MKRTLARVARFIRHHLTQKLGYNLAMLVLSCGMSVVAVSGFITGTNVLLSLLLVALSLFSGVFHGRRFIAIKDHDEMMDKIRIARQRAAQSLGKFPDDDAGLELFLLDDYGQKASDDLRRLWSAGQREARDAFRRFSSLDNKLDALSASRDQHYGLYEAYREIADEAESRFVLYLEAIRQVAHNEQLTVRASDGHVVKSLAQPKEQRELPRLRPSIIRDDDRQMLDQEIKDLEYVFDVAERLDVAIKRVPKGLLRVIKKEQKKSILLPEEIEELRAKIRYAYRELQPKLSKKLSKKSGRRIKLGGKAVLLQYRDDLNRKDINIVLGKTFEN